MLLRALATLLCALAIALATGTEAQAQTHYEAELEAAIEYYFDGYEEVSAHAIVACESGYGADIYNEWSGAYGPWQFMAYTSYDLGFEHSLMHDPWYATWAASEYYEIAGWSPWACAW